MLAPFKKKKKKNEKTVCRGAFRVAENFSGF